tara:strand:+ start:345 stop:560 length:216 start_codon:yes stop_codon:yes gene_type:complete
MKLNKNILKKVKMLLHLIKNNFETIDFAYVFIFFIKIFNFIYFYLALELGSQNDPELPLLSLGLVEGEPEK